MVLPLIPLLLGAGALVSGLTGLKKSWDAKEDFSTAERWIADAETEWTEAAEELEADRQEVSARLAELGALRLRVASKSLSKFTKLVGQVVDTSVETIEVNGYAVPVDAAPMGDVEAATYEATDFLAHGLRGASAGAMVGVGVGQAVGMLGIASTGTAISGLSGAAATNATLAWLGGGSLASGGLGMAGGTAILGGAVAGPVLLVMGYLAAGKAEEAKTQALAHSAEIEEAAEQLRSASVAVRAIDVRAQELAWVLATLDERFHTAANRLSRVLGRIRRERQARYEDAGKPVPANLAIRKITYKSLSAKDQNTLHLTIALGSALHRVAKIELLNKQGRLTPKSKKSIAEMTRLLEVV